MVDVAPLSDWKQARWSGTAPETPTATSDSKREHSLNRACENDHGVLHEKALEKAPEKALLEKAPRESSGECGATERLEASEMVRHRPRHAHSHVRLQARAFAAVLANDHGATTRKLDNSSRR